MNKQLLITKLLVLSWLLLVVKLVSADGIVSITPSEGDAGSTVSVSIILNSDATPPLPPSEVDPSSVLIGSIEATSFTRTDETTITADFDIPSGMVSGNYDVSVELTATYSKNLYPQSKSLSGHLFYHPLIIKHMLFIHHLLIKIFKFVY